MSRKCCAWPIRTALCVLGVLAWAPPALATGPGFAFIEGSAVATQPDGKIVVAGRSFYQGIVALGVARYDSEGATDPGFGSGGFVRTEIGTASAYTERGAAIAVDPDGKIVVASKARNGVTWDISLVRYNSDGSLDSTFGTGGILLTDLGTAEHEYPKSIVLQADGRIVVAGHTGSDLLLLRYTATGTLDSTFAGDGSLRVAAGLKSNWIPEEPDPQLALQSDGRILVAFQTTAETNNVEVRRYDTTGIPDLTFDGDGIATATVPATYALVHVRMALQGDDKVVVASQQGDFWRFSTDGSLDLSFGGGDGMVSIPEFYSVGGLLLRDDGKIVALAETNPGVFTVPAVLNLARLNPDGSLDAGFGDAGITDLEVARWSHLNVYGVALQTDGKILVSGRITSQAPAGVVLRIDEDGSFDSAFGDAGILRETLCLRVPLDAMSCVDALNASAKLCHKPGNFGFPGVTRMGWKWRGAVPLPAPADSGEVEQYALCIYDMHAGTPRFVTWFRSSSNYWNESTDGWLYKNRYGADDFDGVKYVRLVTPESPGLPKASFKVYSENWIYPTLPFSPFSETQRFEADPGVIVQLVNSAGLCMKSEFSGSGIRRHDEECFQGR